MRSWLEPAMAPCAGPPRTNAANTRPEPHPRRPGTLRRATTHVMRPTTTTTHRTARGTTNEVATTGRLFIRPDSDGVTARQSATTPVPRRVPPARTAATRRPPALEGIAAARAHTANTRATGLARRRKYAWL